MGKSGEVKCRRAGSLPIPCCLLGRGTWGVAKGNVCAPLHNIFYFMAWLFIQSSPPIDVVHVERGPESEVEDGGWGERIWAGQSRVTDIRKQRQQLRHRHRPGHRHRHCHRHRHRHRHRSVIVVVSCFVFVFVSKTKAARKCSTRIVAWLPQCEVCLIMHISRLPLPPSPIPPDPARAGYMPPKVVHKQVFGGTGMSVAGLCVYVCSYVWQVTSQSMLFRSLSLSLTLFLCLSALSLVLLSR